MKEDQYFDEAEDGLVFGSRTVLIPGRKVEIGFSIRKKSAFPIVQEMILRLLRTVRGTSLELLVQFFDFSEKEIRDSVRPLLAKGFVILTESEYRLTETGESLFPSSENENPAISESESLQKTFVVDDHCGLPVEASNIGQHVMLGDLKWFIEELQVDPNDKQTPNEKTIQNFNEVFESFIRDKEDIEKFRSDKMALHKTDFIKTKGNLLLRVDVQSLFKGRAIAENRIIPFDYLHPKTERRQNLRGRLIECVTTPAFIDLGNEVQFLRETFGEDFLEGCAINNAVAWHKLVPKFFNDEWPELNSGNRLVIGEACLARNISLIIDLFYEVISDREISPDNPLKIVWVRPAVKSWGRSLEFLESIDRLREACDVVAKGAVEIELWEQREVSDRNGFPQLRSYEKRFDKTKRYSSEKLPNKLEMLLIGDAGGIVLTHAYTPPKACFPCPLGVFFGKNTKFQELMKSEVHGGLRALPKLAKKKKITPKVSGTKQKKSAHRKMHQTNKPEEFS